VLRKCISSQKGGGGGVAAALGRNGFLRIRLFVWTVVVVAAVVV
jgi:hypothetical protein